MVGNSKLSLFWTTLIHLDGCPILLKDDRETERKMVAASDKHYELCMYIGYLLTNHEKINRLYK